MTRPLTDQQIAKKLGTTVANMKRARRIGYASRFLFTAVHMGVLTLDEAEAVITQVRRERKS